MLLDLEGALQVVMEPLRVRVGQPEVLDDKNLWQDSCRAVARLSFLE